MINLYNFTLKIETSWEEEVHFENLECQWRYRLCLFILR